MRIKQEAGLRTSGVLAGEQLRGQPAGGPGSILPEETSVGPRGDAAAPPADSEQCQRWHRAVLEQASVLEQFSLWVDPLQRALAQPPLPLSEPASAPGLYPLLAMDEAWRAVRRIAWGGDRQRGIAYIELGAGELQGGALTLEACGNAISLVVDLPPGASHAGWAERLAERLARRGLEVESVQVR